MKTKNRADRSGAVPASISVPPTHVTGHSVVAPSPKAGKPKFELELERKYEPTEFLSFNMLRILYLIVRPY
jgi:hypothetical protein